jgi:glycine betaine/proline transport system permease protein
VTTVSRVVAPVDAGWKRFAPWVGLAVGALALQAAFAGSNAFPGGLDTLISGPIDEAGAWMRENRRSHPLFTGVFMPISDIVDWVVSGLADVLAWIPWFAVVAIGAMLPITRRMYRQALLVAVVMGYVGVFGLWELAMATLAVMIAAITLAVVVGLPLGVVASRHRRVEAALRPVLDAMQTIPAFVYFLPLLMVFGIGNVPGVVATFIYALPPLVRLTVLGITQVPSSAVESSKMFGATSLQTLVKVQLPMAVRSIVTGMSQTIMMALGIVVLIPLVGAGGLGTAIFESLNQRRPGRGLAVGLAIVAIAIVLDRIARASAERDPLKRLAPGAMAGLAVGVLVIVAVGRGAGWVDFPAVWKPNAFDPIDDVVTWLRDNLRGVTRAMNDFVVADVYLPLRDLLVDVVAWPVVVFVTGWIGWRLRGAKLAIFGAAAWLVIGAVGLWSATMDTAVQVLLATLATLGISVPLGVWAGRSPRLESVLSPFLDALQTVPSLVYLIPFVVFFSVGMFPGLIATVMYSLVPGVRITALGIREVPVESVEAAETFGATPRQILLRVRLPLAAPTIMTAVNQVIMMVIAMVIIAGLAGGGALGFLVVESLARSKFGQGVEVGLALVLLAMLLDRFTEAAADRLRPPAGS